jgi:hypothetical protein
MTTVPTSSRPIELTELPPVLSAKLAILRATDPAMYTTVTGRDPVSNTLLINEQDTKV